MYLFLKPDATVSIFIIILNTYLISLTLFLCIYFTCICIHMHFARCHVLYTIKFNIIISTAQYMVYHNKVVSKNRLILDQLQRFYLYMVSTQFNRLQISL